MTICDTESAKHARTKAAGYRREAARQRKYQNLTGATAYSRFVLRAIRALEMRAETEERIAELYESAATRTNAPESLDPEASRTT